MTDRHQDHTDGGGALSDEQQRSIAALAAATGTAYGLALSKSATWSGAAGVKGLPDDAVIGFANVTDAAHASRARDFVTYLRFE